MVKFFVVEIQSCPLILGKIWIQIGIIQAAISTKDRYVFAVWNAHVTIAFREGRLANDSNNQCIGSGHVLPQSS